MAFLFKTKFRAIFTTTTVSLSSYAAFDKYQFKIVMDDLKERASVIALQPMQVSETPRKIVLYITASQYATHTFNSYIKPVFDAGALDYDVVDVKQSYTEHLQEYIWTGKDEAALRPPLNSPRTWTEYFFGKEPLQVQKGKYNPDVGIVCIGDDVFGKVCKGVEQGAYGKRPIITKVDPIPPVTDVSLETAADSTAVDHAKEVIEEQEVTDIEKESQSIPIESTETTEEIIAEIPMDLSSSNLPPQSPKDVTPMTANTFDLFPMGFIYAKNLVGFKHFFERIFMWFHERELGTRLGEQALLIVLDEKVDMQRDDYPEAYANLPAEIKKLIRVYH